MQMSKKNIILKSLKYVNYSKNGQSFKGLNQFFFDSLNFLFCRDNQTEFHSFIDISDSVELAQLHFKEDFWKPHVEKKSFLEYEVMYNFKCSWCK